MAGRGGLTVSGMAWLSLLIMLPLASAQVVVPSGPYWWRCPGWRCFFCCNKPPTQDTGAGGKVKVGVYFESKCSDSMHFFTQQLYPAWTQLKDIMEVDLVPFGKARATPTGYGDYTFECQHLAEECHGNKVMSCIQKYYPIETQMAVMNCMMSDANPAKAGPKCSSATSLYGWNTVDSCSRSTTGSQLLYDNGVKTAAIKPQKFFVPTVTIDGQYFDAENQKDLASFKTALCNAYRGPKPQNCFYI